MKTYDLSTLSLMVIDDNQNMISLLQVMLKAFGVRQLVMAQGGEEALEILKTHTPDMILTDWRMSPMNGEQFVKVLRAEKNYPTCFIPVIAISAYSELTRVQEARAAGVNQFLVKPISAESLYRRIMWTIEQQFQCRLLDGRYVPIVEKMALGEGEVKGQGADPELGPELGPELNPDTGEDESVWIL